jgi:hypothetical protein
MKTRKRPLPIPQHEFGFTVSTFTLFSDATLDGERLTREHAEALEARRRTASAQPSFAQLSTLNPATAHD